MAKYKRLDGGIEFVASIPKSAAGKILRKDLKAAYEAKFGKDWKRPPPCLPLTEENFSIAYISGLENDHCCLKAYKFLDKSRNAIAKHNGSDGLFCISLIWDL